MTPGVTRRLLAGQEYESGEYEVDPVSILFTPAQDGVTLQDYAATTEPPTDDGTSLPTSSSIATAMVGYYSMLATSIAALAIVTMF